MKPPRRNFVSPVPTMRTDINSVPPNPLYAISAGLAFELPTPPLRILGRTRPRWPTSLAHASRSPVGSPLSAPTKNPAIVASQRSKARLLQEVNVHSRLAQVIWRDAHKAKGAGEHQLRRRPPSRLVPRHFGPPSL